MSRSPAVPASLIVLASLCLALPAAAQSGNSTQIPAQVAAQDATAAGAAAAVTQRAPATEEVRAAYDRLDPLTRSVFWSEEAQLFPMDPIAGVRAAQSLRELGRFEQAVQMAQAVLVVQPQNTDAMLEVGRGNIARGQAFYGIQALEQAQAMMPGDWRPLSLLGVAYQQVRRNDDAQAAWAHALALSPDNPDVLANMGMAFATSGEVDQAETYLRRAASQPGAGLKVRQNLALVLGVQGKMAEAEQILRRDLPPELAEANLQWLRDRTDSRAQASVPATASGTARTWTSLQ